MFSITIAAALFLLATSARAAGVDVSAVETLIMENMESVGLVGGSVLSIWVLIPAFRQLRELLGFGEYLIDEETGERFFYSSKQQAIDDADYEYREARRAAFSDSYDRGEAVEGVDFITVDDKKDF